MSFRDFFTTTGVETPGSETQPKITPTKNPEASPSSVSIRLDLGYVLKSVDISILVKSLRDEGIMEKIFESAFADDGGRRFIVKMLSNSPEEAKKAFLAEVETLFDDQQDEDDEEKTPTWSGWES